MNPPIIYSFALSQIFGLFLFIVAIIFVSRKDYYSNVFAKMKSDNPLIMFVAICCLLIGLILISTHGVYYFQYRLVVTIFCWLVFLNGLLWLMIPEKMLSIAAKIMQGKSFYIFTAFIALIGFWILFRGTEIFILKEGV